MPDLFCVGCDTASRILPEHLVQPDNRNTAACNDFTEYRSRSDRRQLVCIANQDNPFPILDGFKQIACQVNIQHRNLIDYD